MLKNKIVSHPAGAILVLAGPNGRFFFLDRLSLFLEKYKAFPSFNKYGNYTKSGEYEKNCPYWSSFYSI
ncbi:hypothetical protein P7H16_02830 [Paenibacillus larvae]|nr:hypothetical protein [Paenibacillus larvae]MDT2246155.1 hypothetical protein [Paenibacillus larvae]MDT2286140.1 hypothetical protein [Paenibacillus larvae]MDT2292745.1 hypothetical protein [Paenibacillus larvae]MDT2304027.1 hypothetical protein [Paenibacillus larvae]